MKRLSILSFLALFAAALTQQGAAWAQTEDTKAADWGQVPTITSAWTHIKAGSTKGFELKDDNYYVTEDLTFTNVNGGAGQGSGIYVQEGRTVRLYIPAGVTLTVIGANADSTSAAGAGILLPSTSTLYIVGEGSLVATGGNAANGADGGNGTDGIENTESPKTWFLGKEILCGIGGSGGYGGGGAGAGIGTAGGNGGATTPMVPEEYRPKSMAEWTGGDIPGLPGTNGQPGATAAPMGKLFIQPTITTKITGGAKGKGGARGRCGKVVCGGGEIEITDINMVNGIPIPEIDLKDLQSIAGGGGGGGGAGGTGASGHAGWAYPYVVTCTDKTVSISSSDLSTLANCGYEFPSSLISSASNYGTQNLTGKTGKAQPNGGDGSQGDGGSGGGSGETRTRSGGVGGASASIDIGDPDDADIDYSCTLNGTSTGDPVIVRTF